MAETTCYIDKGLLIDPAHAFQGADVESILSPQITGMRWLDLAPGLVIEFLLLQGLDLNLGEDDAVFGDLGLQGFQTLLEVGQVVAQLD